jgi:hypothetical protein
MIYIKNLDTVFIRPPKTGSTTLTLYVADSGLLNIKHDFRDWELGQAMWMPDGSVDMSNYHNTPDAYPETNYNVTTEEAINESLKKKIKAEFAAGSQKFLIHGSYTDGVEAGKYTTSAKCIATVRHPIDRLMSIIHVRLSPFSRPFDAPKEDLNEHAIERLEGRGYPAVFQDQHKLYNNAPILWNTENIHDHATAYFATNGGVIRQRWHARRNERRPAGIADQLTNEIKQKILTRYEKDFLLWEKAYAVYN